MHVPEILAFAEKRIQDNAGLDQISVDYQVLRCLVAIAPNSPEAVECVNSILRRRWNSFSKLTVITPEKAEESFQIPPDQTTQFRLSFECTQLIRALAEIGIPAIPAIPLLDEIQNSQKSDVNAPTSLPFGMGGGGSEMSSPFTLRDRCIAAIKQIQEAKPKPKPEPLPIGEEVSAVNQNRPLTTQVHPTKPANPSQPRVEPTYDGIAQELCADEAELPEGNVLFEFERELPDTPNADIKPE